MAESLAKKKRIRAGHRASATRILNQIEGLLADTALDTSRLLPLKLSLSEKLETLKVLDGEVQDLVDEGGLVADIEQADSFKEDIYAAIVKIDK